MRMLGGTDARNGPDVPKQEPLSTMASHLLEECRMVLPGIQALFGFQLIAVFNTTFWELPASSRMIHLIAIGLVATAVAFVMTPAAYHRLALRTAVSRSFVQLSSKLLLCSMFPLLLGICLDFYLIAVMILSSTAWAIAWSLTLVGIFVSLWFGLPFVIRQPDATKPQIASIQTSSSHD
jgi:hypothetical protein